MRYRLVKYKGKFGVERGWICKRYLDMKAQSVVFWWRRGSLDFSDCWTSDKKEAIKRLKLIKNPPQEEKIEPVSDLEGMLE